MIATDRYSGPEAVSRTLLRSMADNTQLPPPGGLAGNSAVAAEPRPEPRRAVVAAVLLLVAGAVLGVIGGLIWAAEAPRVVYQVYTLTPPTAYATNPETSAFIATDGIYTVVALIGGALLGLAGYWLAIRRYGPVPMAGLVLGAVAAAFLARWIGNLATGGRSFNSVLATSKPHSLLHAPISLGAGGAIAFWPVAAALVAGGLELLSFMRARQASQGQHALAARLPYGIPPPPPQPFRSADQSGLARPYQPPVQSPHANGSAGADGAWPDAPPRRYGAADPDQPGSDRPVG
jgi:hypothetical protein